MVFGARNLKLRVLGPSGYHILYLNIFTYILFYIIDRTVCEIMSTPIGGSKDLQGFCLARA